MRLPPGKYRASRLDRAHGYILYEYLVVLGNHKIGIEYISFGAAATELLGTTFNPETLGLRQEPAGPD